MSAPRQSDQTQVEHAGRIPRKTQLSEVSANVSDSPDVDETADAMSMSIDQHGLGRPKASDKMIDQQGAGCLEKSTQAEDGGLKAKLKIRNDFRAC